MSFAKQGGILALGAGAEFDVIRALVARWGSRATGIGDDAAFFAVPRGDAVVASVDTAVEGLHFRAEWLSAREIGYRAVTAAMSDLAAMAARPLGILVALALPASWRLELDGLADGIADAVDAAGARIFGGNTVAAEELSLTTTALGAAFSVLRRDAVRAGDALYLTGNLGGPGAALRAWMEGRLPDPAHRMRFAAPRARVHEARWLAERGATGAIDISDGLASDAGHLAAASALRLEVDLTRLPMLPGLTDVEAVTSGEEYELIVSAATPVDVSEFETRFGIPLTRIGRAMAGEPGVTLHRDGERVALPRGYDHLSR